MDKQLKDYLHYYIGHVDYRVKYIDGSSWTVWSKLTPGRYARAVEDHSVEKIEIVVRKLESMTEDEWQEIRFHLSADIVAAVPIIKWQDRPRWVVVLENRIQTNTLKFLDGIELIKRGFDLFGLIDAGLAVDKDTLENNSK